MTKHFVRTSHGVHLMSPVGGGEFTLCGIAFDAADSEQDKRLRFRGAKREIVTCDLCANVVEVCRDVKVRRRP